MGETDWRMAHSGRSHRDETGRRLGEIHLAVLAVPVIADLRLPGRLFVMLLLVVLLLVVIRVHGSRLDHRLGDLLLKTLQVPQNVRIGQQTGQKRRCQY